MRKLAGFFVILFSIFSLVSCESFHWGQNRGQPQTATPPAEILPPTGTPEEETSPSEAAPATLDTTPLPTSNVIPVDKNTTKTKKEPLPLAAPQKSDPSPTEPKPTVLDKPNTE